MNTTELIAESQSKADDLLKEIGRHKARRTLLITIGVLITTTVVAFWNFELPIPPRLSGYKLYLYAFVGSIGALSILIGFMLTDSDLKIRRAKALADASAYKAIKEQSATNFFIEYLGQVVLSQSNQYYQFVLTNAQRTSKLTISLMTVGFILILLGILIGIKTENYNHTATYASSGSGVVLEFLTFILSYNKESVTLMDKYMNKLESFSQTLLALSLLDTATQESDKEKMRSMWFVQLVRVLSPPTSAPLVTTSPSNQA